MGKEVTIYSTPTCHYCQMTKEFLKEKGINYTDYNVAEDAEKRQEMIEKSGQMGVPVIFVSSGEEGVEPEMMIGFDQAKLSAALGI